MKWMIWQRLLFLVALASLWIACSADGDDDDGDGRQLRKKQKVDYTYKEHYSELDSHGIKDEKTKWFAIPPTKAELDEHNPGLKAHADEIKSDAKYKDYKVVALPGKVTGFSIPPDHMRAMPNHAVNFKNHIERIEKGEIKPGDREYAEVVYKNGKAVGLVLEKEDSSTKKTRDSFFGNSAAAQKKDAAHDALVVKYGLQDKKEIFNGNNPQAYAESMAVDEAAPFSTKQSGPNNSHMAVPRPESDSQGRWLGHQYKENKIKDNEKFIYTFTDMDECKATVRRRDLSSGLYRRAPSACQRRVNAMNEQFKKGVVMRPDGSMDIKAALANAKKGRKSLSATNAERVATGKAALNFKKTAPASKWVPDGKGGFKKAPAGGPAGTDAKKGAGGSMKNMAGKSSKGSGAAAKRGLGAKKGRQGAAKRGLEAKKGARRAAAKRGLGGKKGARRAAAKRGLGGKKGARAKRGPGAKKGARGAAAKRGPGAKKGARRAAAKRGPGAMKGAPMKGARRAAAKRGPGAMKGARRAAAKRGPGAKKGARGAAAKRGFGAKKGRGAGKTSAARRPGAAKGKAKKSARRPAGKKAGVRVAKKGQSRRPTGAGKRARTGKPGAVKKAQPKRAQPKKAQPKRSQPKKAQSQRAPPKKPQQQKPARSNGKKGGGRKK
ncbi:hypothetical protein HDU67_006575 [Dinochytrium kinnereticum]|nr:hypothetical protein HDU67_006575 [Dinochytrium kinnereticum]